MYTTKFGSMPCPAPELPGKLEESARSWYEDTVRIHDGQVSKDHGRFEVQFSLKHPGVVKRCPDALYDDDFEILFGDYGYVVWCFDKDISLPHINALLDVSLRQGDSTTDPLPLNRRI